MRLSNLVKNIIDINGVDSTSLVESHKQYVDSIMKILAANTSNETEELLILRQQLNAIDSAVKETSNVLKELESKFKQEINSITQGWDSRGYTALNGNEGACALPYEFEKQNRFSLISDITKQKVLSEIFKHTNPKYPCLEIGPGEGDWTHHLVAGDPLYIVDIHQESLDATAEKFPAQFRKRLRSYLLDFSNCYNLDCLPQNQFGFVFSWNVFDYFPLNETRQYLKSCYGVIRPGGYMLFSYNNCNHVSGSSYAEVGHKSWMTEETIIKECEEIGFEISTNNNTDESWLLVRKPGILKSVKTHQALGEILNHSA